MDSYSKVSQTLKGVEVEFTVDEDKQEVFGVLDDAEDVVDRENQFVEIDGTE